MKKAVSIALLALALALPAYAQTDCRARAGGGYSCYDYSSGSSTDLTVLLSLKEEDSRVVAFPVPASLPVAFGDDTAGLAQAPQA